jgi:hypothetical protein
MCHDDKIACIAGKDTVDPVKYGGKSYDEWVHFSVYLHAPGSQGLINNSELPVIAKDHYRQEEEQKFRCLTCGKMFKSAGYVCKHISNKHPELPRDNEAMYEVGRSPPHALLFTNYFDYLESSDCTTTLRWIPTGSRCLHHLMSHLIADSQHTETVSNA